MMLKEFFLKLLYSTLLIDEILMFFNCRVHAKVIFAKEKMYKVFSLIVQIVVNLELNDS